MPNVWCVRAGEQARYTEDFLQGGYIAIGWQLDDLSGVQSRDEIERLHRITYPDETNPYRRRTHVSSIEIFRLKIQAWDFVITPDANTEWLHYGLVGPDPSYFYWNGADGCRYRHRRWVVWSEELLRRHNLSQRFQGTMGGPQTAFWVDHREEFLLTIGVNGRIWRLEQIVSNLVEQLGRR